MIECFECEGSGWSPYGDNNCPACGGTGDAGSSHRPNNPYTNIPDGEDV